MSDCRHTWVYQESYYGNDANGQGVITYTKTDIYYCSKCLELREAEKCEKRYRDQSPPDWWRR
jgi:hypothetical protein